MNDISTFNKKTPVYSSIKHYIRVLSVLFDGCANGDFEYIQIYVYSQFLNSPDIPIGRVTSTPVCTQREAATPTCMSQGIAACTVQTR